MNKRPKSTSKAAKYGAATAVAAVVVVLIVVFAVAPWGNHGATSDVENPATAPISQNPSSTDSNANANNIGVSAGSSTTSASSGTTSSGDSISSNNSNVKSSSSNGETTSATNDETAVGGGVSDDGSSGGASSGEASGGGSNGDGSSGGASGGNDHESLKDSSGTDFANYPYYEGTETDKYGRTILTSAAAGKQLKEGVTYVVVSNVKLAPSDYRAGLVANNNLIYIAANASLTCVGANGSASNPGLPGIALTSDHSLCVSGEGTLNCVGGNAGDGSQGGSGGNGGYNDSSDRYWSGAGGDGGTGGGGAGAGIGTAGSAGGSGGSGASGGNCEQWPSSSHEENGRQGSAGSAASPASEAGYLCVTGTVSVTLSGGQAGRGGSGGSAGSSSIAFHTWKYIGAAGGGGGGGGAGGPANGYGQGGTGGTGGSGGGSGGCVYRRRGVSDDAPTGGGGAGGAMGGTADLGPSLTGHGATGNGSQTTITDVTGGAGGSEGQQSAAPSLAGARRLTVTYSAQGKIVGYQCDGKTRVREGATAVVDYTGFASVPNNHGWYVSNNLANQDGTGQVGATFQSVIGATTAADLKKALTANIPQRAGLTFAGWDLVNADGSTVRIYDATTDVFDFACLSSEAAHVTTAGSTAQECVWMTRRNVTFRAVWDNPTYTICYHANLSQFLDPVTLKPAGTDTCPVPGMVSGADNQLWDNQGSGVYLVSAPAGTLGKHLVWSTAIDAKGESIGEEYLPGEMFKCTVHETGVVYDMYACWVSDNYASDVGAFNEIESQSSEAQASEDEEPLADGADGADDLPSSNKVAALEKIVLSTVQRLNGVLHDFL